MKTVVQVQLWLFLNVCCSASPTTGEYAKFPFNHNLLQCVRIHSLQFHQRSLECERKVGLLGLSHNFGTKRWSKARIPTLSISDVCDPKPESLTFTGSQFNKRSAQVVLDAAFGPLMIIATRETGRSKWDWREGRCEISPNGPAFLTYNPHLWHEM